ncbi:hypothetical protein T05_15798 [Trichinella murrelli]|uniref:PiggyBac transposable element-derived protein domain-containing protein n=1 Tax=Trichinella murrelli TaxID=144512 RepID=A0A0V0UA72_9BILA|nr:hypothetical protein T05_15798 [Trichinella murrelli]
MKKIIIFHANLFWNFDALQLLYLVVRRPSDTRPSTNNAHVSLFRSNLTFTKNDKIVLWKILTKQKSYNGKNCNRGKAVEVMELPLFFQASSPPVNDKASRQS